MNDDDDDDLSGNSFAKVIDKDSSCCELRLAVDADFLDSVWLDTLSKKAFAACSKSSDSLLKAGPVSTVSVFVTTSATTASRPCECASREDC